MDAQGPSFELRQVTIADLRVILGELEDFWQERDMGFLHQALYVHEFGRSSVLAEADGRVLGYLLGFVGQDGDGYIHAVAVRREARGGGLARSMYDRFAELAAGQGAGGLKAITAPENSGSRAFHAALGFSEETVADYSPSGGARIVFRKPLVSPSSDADRGRLDLGEGASLAPVALADIEELHGLITANRDHLRRWLPFADQPFERTEGYVRRCVAAAASGEGLDLAIRDGERLIGMISLVDLSREHRVTNVGYWLAEGAQGRGIATRAAKAIVGQAFEDWGLERVEIRVAVSNTRSRAIPERLGFRREGELRSAHLLDGIHLDELVYGLLAAEWPVGG